MNLGTLHPIAQYIFWSFFIICMPIWVLDMTTVLKLRSRKFRNEEIILNLGYFILFIGYLIFSSFVFVFFAFAGLVINFNFWWSLCMLGVFSWILLEYINSFSTSFGISYKKMSIIFLGSFVLLFLFFYAYFYEDRIYKVSKYCKPTGDLKVKICKFSNGVYTGELKAFLRHGQGTYKYNSGASYSGGWQNSLRHGTGVTITAKGVKTTNMWKKGKKSD